MTEGKIMAFTGALVKVFAVGSMILIIPMAVSHCEASRELEGTKTDLTLKTEQIKGYEAKISLQNQAIETLDLQSRAAEERFDRAVAAAESQNKKLDKTIAQLKSAKGTNCDDAMSLVDEVIRRGQ